MTSRPDDRAAVLARLAACAWRIRRFAVRMGEVQGQGYVGQALGYADVLAVAYGHAMRFRADEPEWPERDRFLLSHGHYAIAHYAALIEAGKDFRNVQKLYDAILWNKRVWDTFAYECAAEDNQLPKEIRAGLISLAIWVNKETTSVMDGQKDLEPLISVNKSIIEGLR